VNRDGQATPAVNPAAHAASTPAAPITASDHGALPQACWPAVTPNRTPVHAA
jgi:hypothetical protein